VKVFQSQQFGVGDVPNTSVGSLADVGNDLSHPLSSIKKAASGAIGQAADTAIQGVTGGGQVGGAISSVLGGLINKIPWRRVSDGSSSVVSRGVVFTAVTITGVVCGLMALYHVSKHKEYRSVPEEQDTLLVE